MTKKLEVADLSPYQLFKGDDHQMNLFLKHCRTCTRGARDNDCPIIAILTESIVNNKDLRWDARWITLDTGWPVCTQYAGKEKK